MENRTLALLKLQKQSRGAFFYIKKVVLRILAKFRRKHPCWCLIPNYRLQLKTEDWRPEILLKHSPENVFSCERCIFLRTSIQPKIWEWLLMNLEEILKELLIQFIKKQYLVKLVSKSRCSEKRYSAESFSVD